MAEKEEQRWSWHDSDSKESIVFQTMQGVAVYTNPGGDIVIRQEGPMGEDDSVIILPRALAKGVAEAIEMELDRPI